MIELTKNIESHYITSYGEEISEVICYIVERTIENDPFQDFIFSTKDYNYFFDSIKINKNNFEKLPFHDANNIIASAIIKEVKYDEHFMSWEKGKEYLKVFLNNLENIEEIYTNSFWKKNKIDNTNIDEFSLIAWTGISHNYWYDYGFVIVTPTKIGVLWFGDDS